MLLQLRGAHQIVALVVVCAQNHICMVLGNLGDPAIRTTQQQREKLFLDNTHAVQEEEQQILVVGRAESRLLHTQVVRVQDNRNEHVEQNKEHEQHIGPVEDRHRGLGRWMRRILGPDRPQCDFARGHAQTRLERGAECAKLHNARSADNHVPANRISRHNHHQRRRIKGKCWPRKLERLDQHCHTWLKVKVVQCLPRVEHGRQTEGVARKIGNPLGSEIGAGVLQQVVAPASANVVEMERDARDSKRTCEPVNHRPQRCPVRNHAGNHGARGLDGAVHFAQRRKQELDKHKHIKRLAAHHKVVLARLIGEQADRENSQARVFDHPKHIEAKDGTQPRRVARLWIVEPKLNFDLGCCIVDEIVQLGLVDLGKHGRHPL
eukprot:comp22105_c0_seq1/m.51399 comp22105_c0_seq1/g.51399  ORF comp22105_c0_seq1/g.51399 comp22105_c0_seq1/m.51399 type:complete len:378 (-) comp22105_c0_seq1:1165-2298(-)